VVLGLDREGAPKGLLTAGYGAAFWNPSVTHVHEHVLWVDPKARSQGIGKALLKTLEAWARELEAKVVSAGSARGLGHKATGAVLDKMGYRLEEKIYVKEIA
jgi:GNAT superfamily N-acetyltransferase